MDAGATDTFDDLRRVTLRPVAAPTALADGPGLTVDPSGVNDFIAELRAGTWTESTLAAYCCGVTPPVRSRRTARPAGITGDSRRSAPERHIQRQGRWRNARTVRRDIEDGTGWDETSATRLGL